MKLTLSLIAISLLFLTSAAAPAEVWLTPEREVALKRVTSRPYVASQENLGDGSVVYHWTNGRQASVTTQRVERILGKPAKSAWQDKLDAKEREKQTILNDLKAVKEKPSKKDIEAIINKHSKKD